jgi:hypothetical protein
MVSLKKRFAIRKKKIEVIVTFDLIIISGCAFAIIAILK